MDIDKLRAIIPDYKAEFGEESINGKTYKPWQFQRNNKAACVNKGRTKNDTVIRQSFAVTDMRKFRTYMGTYGISRVMAIMETMSDADFLKAFLLMSPYSLPRISSIDYKAGEDKINSIDGDQHTHTVTIRDMRTGSVKVIQDL